MIISSEHKIMIFTDHSVNPLITHQIKLVMTDTVKQNLYLVRVLMFLQEFNLTVIYKLGRSHTMSDAFSRLPSFNKMDSNTEALKIDDYHALTGSFIIISENFKKHLEQSYKKDRF